MQRFDTRAPTFVGLGMLFRDASRDHVHVSLRLGKRHSGFETADDQQPVEVVVDLIRLECQRHHELGFKAINLPGPVYTNHGIRLTVHLDLFANNIWVGAEMSPKAMGEDRNMVFANLTFLR